MRVVHNYATLSKTVGLGQTHPKKQLAVKVLTTKIASDKVRCSIRVRQQRILLSGVSVTFEDDQHHIFCRYNAYVMC